MARIETYPLDYAITPNDFVLGSDGDNLNATRNYNVATFLGYLGNMYGLSSQDMYFTYNPVASGSVGSGEISSNNYADVTRNMADITNLYISKLTELGALAEDFINAIATDGISIVLMDLGARENYAIIQLTSSSDVDANTINLVGTVSQSNGVLVTGRSIGIKIGAGGGSVDLSNYVDRTTSQTISGIKTFNSPLHVGDQIIYNTDGSPTGYASGGASGYLGSSAYYFWKDAGGSVYGSLDFNGLTATRTYTMPDASGTIALEGSFVDLTNDQTIAGQKTFTELFKVNTTANFTASPYFYSLSPSGLRITNDTTLPSPNNGGFYITASSGGWNLVSPNGTAGASNTKVRFLNNNTNPTGGDTSLTAAQFFGQVEVSDDPYSLDWNGDLTVPTKNAVYDQFQNISSNDPYGAGWNNSLTVPTRNAVYDKIETMVSDGAYPTGWNGDTDTAPSRNAVFDQIQAITIDYAANTFTPTLIDAGSGATYSGTISGSYTRIGDRVHVNITMSGISTTGTPSGILYIGNLPYGVAEISAGTVGRFSGSSTTFYSIGCQFVSTSDRIYFYMQKALDGNFGNGAAEGSITITSGEIYVTGVYKTNDAI